MYSYIHIYINIRVSGTTSVPSSLLALLTGSASSGPQPRDRANTRKTRTTMDRICTPFSRSLVRTDFRLTRMHTLRMRINPSFHGYSQVCKRAVSACQRHAHMVQLDRSLEPLLYSRNHALSSWWFAVTLPRLFFYWWKRAYWT